MICGDHVCVNKKEANQYFEENLSLEVKLIDEKNKNNINLIELNLKENIKQDKQLVFKKKNNTKEKIKVLSKKEIKDIKIELKNKEKIKQVKKNNIAKKNKNLNISKNKNDKIEVKNIDKIINGINDACSFVEKCNIEEITKYLTNESKKKGFPDITIRQ